MIRLTLVAASTLVSSVIVLAPAHAANVLPQSTAPSNWDTAAYFEGAAGGYTNEESGDDGPNRGLAWSGAMRGVVFLSPAASVQADAWLSEAHNPAGFSIDSIGGLALHASWRPDSQNLIGLFGSLGRDDEDNVGIEAVNSGSDYRLYAQLGLLHQQFIEPGETFQAPYVALTGDYFVDPDLMLEATVGWERYDGDNGYQTYDGNTLFWGARAEYKPDATPFSFFAEYRGSHSAGSAGITGPDSTDDNRFVLGLRLPIGSDSVQDLQNRDGLKDLNPDYGAYSSPTAAGGGGSVS